MCVCVNIYPLGDESLDFNIYATINNVCYSNCDCYIYKTTEISFYQKGFQLLTLCAVVVLRIMMVHVKFNHEPTPI